MRQMSVEELIPFLKLDGETPPEALVNHQEFISTFENSSGHLIAPELRIDVADHLRRHHVKRARCGTTCPGEEPKAPTPGRSNRGQKAVDLPIASSPRLHASGSLQRQDSALHRERLSRGREQSRVPNGRDGVAQEDDRGRDHLAAPIAGFNRASARNTAHFPAENGGRYRI
jgi:hypothetical protein